jgi:hypothetical protein
MATKKPAVPTAASLKIESPWVNESTRFFGEVDVAKPSADDEQFYSVTTIIGALDKPALLYWAAEQTAIAACNVASSLKRRITEEGEEAVIKWLRDARFRTIKGQRSAAELGTAVHDACEKYALTGVRPDVDDEVRPFLDRFDEFCQVWQPIYQAVEAAVYNRTYGYAGTLDAIAIIDGQTVILDYKSSRKSIGSDGKPTGPYPEAALQLSAYRHAELMAVWRARKTEKFRRRYYLLSTDEKDLGVPLPKIDGGVVLHLTPEHATLHPVRCDEMVFEKFLFTQEIFKWSNEVSKHVIGRPMDRVAI